MAIIGGGAAGLLLAAFLDSSLFDITIYEKNKTFGRKLLVAGKGGFNLTHSEPIADLIQRYTPTNFLEEALLHFSNEDLRNWLETIGIPTFIGSSKRIYPKEDIKPIDVLSKILEVLKSKDVAFKFEHDWTGWNAKNELIFENQEIVSSDYIVFALGGGSWKVTGSDGSWLDIFRKQDIETIPFKPANCAYQIEWNPDFLQKHSGSPLKNIAVTCGSKYQKGELVITDFGLEGNAIYALSPEIQSELDSLGKATIYIDLKPSLTEEDIKKRIENSNKKITETLSKDLNLSRLQINLIKDQLTKDEFLNTSVLASSIKALEFNVLAPAQIDEAISTTGGIPLDQVDSNHMLKKLPDHYCIGEMLDWNAPTGGYLLQACFSMGVHLASHINTSNKR